MPYIAKSERVKFESILNDFSKILEVNDLSAGDMNFLLTSLLYRFSKKTTPNYKKYNEIIGVFECAKIEFYRRLISEYEEKKIKENGDFF